MGQAIREGQVKLINDVPDTYMKVHSASIEGNPNHVLVTRFLKNARNHLKPGGLVIMSTVDSPFYEGAFKMNEAARKAGFAAPAVYTFDPKDYPGYTHQNTANEESAADGHTAFATFVFSG